MGLLYLPERFGPKTELEKYSGGLKAGAPSLMQHLPLAVAAPNPVEFHGGELFWFGTEAVTSTGCPEGKRWAQIRAARIARERTTKGAIFHSS
jgi:hypothetical protein